MKNQYDRKMKNVCEFIHQNLDQCLTVKRLSQVAHFSEYHFHRQFSAYFGVSVAKYITQTRLKRASYELCFLKEKSITDIAMDAKYEFSESFSRAFKKEYGISPMAFRMNPDWLSWNQKMKKTTIPTVSVMNVNITDFKETKVAVLEHLGPAEKVNESVMKFVQWRKSTGLSPISQSRTFGLIYHDPAIVEPNEFRFDICGEVLKPIPNNEFSVVNKTIPQGRVAVLRHTGSHDLLDEKVHYLYGKWLPESGEETGDFPCFFHYHNFFPEVAEHELITDIFLPLSGRT